MGLLFSKIFSSLFGNREVRVLILGLDNAGKTTILYKLHSPNRVIRTIPTIGFNVETVVFKNLNFSVWDLGGQTNIRPYWRCYYANTHAVIFVVDSSDVDRIGTARKELMALLEEEELKAAVLLVFANKQDQKGAVSESQLAEQLGLTLVKNRTWHICRAVATKGDGLVEGLDWLANQLNTSQSKSQAVNFGSSSSSSMSALSSTSVVQSSSSASTSSASSSSSSSASSVSKSASSAASSKLTE